jgi:hypothetical protein
MAQRLRFRLMACASLAFAATRHAAGQPVGTEFRVNTYTTSSEENAAAAGDAAGNFVIVWRGASPDGDVEVLGKRYSAAGLALTGDFRINTYVTGDQ